MIEGHFRDAVAVSDISEVAGWLDWTDASVGDAFLGLVDEILAGRPLEYRQTAFSRLNAFANMIFDTDPDLSPYISPDLEFLFPEAVMAAIARCPLFGSDRFDPRDFKETMLLLIPAGGMA
ncbi:MAG: hypothetical protein JWR80_4813 [Bradyrhizobium sp.]|nr:hypothetical protein [Bradyrhizobium sp.]